MDDGADSILDARAADELAVLRRRAYGPQADIAADPVALARLAELEAAARPAPLPAPDHLRGSAASEADDPDRTATVEEPSPGVEARRPPDTNAVEIPPDSRGETADVGEEAASPPSLGVIDFVRRRWLAITASVVAIVAMVVTFTIVTQPRVDATLVRAASGDRAPEIIVDPTYLQYLRVEEGDFVPYEDYFGLRPWVAPREGGGWCLAIALDRDVYQVSCAPESLRLIADIPIEADYPVVPDLDLPPGSVIRFELRGDVVDVRVAEQPPAPAP